jgi:hypothetical protein
VRAPEHEEPEHAEGEQQQDGEAAEGGEIARDLLEPGGA